VSCSAGGGCSAAPGGRTWPPVGRACTTRARPPTRLPAPNRALGSIRLALRSFEEDGDRPLALAALHTGGVGAGADEPGRRRPAAQDRHRPARQEARHPRRALRADRHPAGRVEPRSSAAPARRGQASAHRRGAGGPGGARTAPGDPELAPDGGAAGGRRLTGRPSAAGRAQHRTGAWPGERAVRFNRVMLLDELRELITRSRAARTAPPPSRTEILWRLINRRAGRDRPPARPRRQQPDPHRRGGPLDPGALTASPSRSRTSRGAPA